MPDYGERYEDNGDGYGFGYGAASPPAKGSGFNDLDDSRSQAIFSYMSWFLSIVLNLAYRLLFYAISLALCFLQESRELSSILERI